MAKPKIKSDKAIIGVSLEELAKRKSVPITVSIDGKLFVRVASTCRDKGYGKEQNFVRIAIIEKLEREKE